MDAGNGGFLVRSGKFVTRRFTVWHGQQRVASLIMHLQRMKKVRMAYAFHSQSVDV